MEFNGTLTEDGPATVSPAALSPAGHKYYSDEEVRQLVAALEEPFDPREIKWRVTNTTADKRRGQMLAYADPRAYTDRLNESFTVRGWTRRYAVQTINNVERKFHDGTQQIAGKIVVTCEVSIHALGTHSGIGEEWADNENAGTAAEAQAFKRACACFGLGRYLYDLGGVWVDLDNRKQPKSTPKLPDWALPKRKPTNGGTGPQPANQPPESQKTQPTNGDSAEDIPAVQAQIGRVAGLVGHSLSRSVLMKVANVETPEKVPPSLLRAVSEKLDDILRGVKRLRAATAIVGQQRYAQLCRELNFSGQELGDIPDRKGLEKLIEVLEPEAAAKTASGNGDSTSGARNMGTNGNGHPAASSGNALREARSALIQEAQRVGRLKGMKVAETVDRAAKGAFTFNSLQRLTAESLAAIRAATEVLKKVS